MKKYSFITLFIIFIYGCSAPINNPLHNSKSAEIIHEGVINCFKNEIFDNKNKPINCEASAVFLGVNSLIIAEDKEIKQENLSPVFSIPLVENFPYIIPSNSVTYLTAEPFINVKKIEDMTKEPFGDLCFATTDFEWITDDPVEADAYNSILYWIDGKYEDIKYINETIDMGVKSSKDLRRLFLKALESKDYPNGPPYFKIEGICALPDSILLFGIREIGASYENPQYKFIVLSTKYYYTNGIVTLDTSIKKCYEINPEKQVGIKVGLSGIAYNKFSDEIYFSTSYENVVDPNVTKFSAYLWSIQLEKFKLNEESKVILDKYNRPLKLEHKVEGITFISKDILFTVSDQDRLISPVTIGTDTILRKTYQAIYTVIKIIN